MINKSEVKKDSKTFEEMGVVFTAGTGCHTCTDDSCHNTVPLRETGEDYFVHIQTNPSRTRFFINASVAGNTSTSDSSEFNANFFNESDAVKYVCDTFDWFKCS